MCVCGGGGGVWLTVKYLKLHISQDVRNFCSFLRRHWP